MGRRMGWFYRSIFMERRNLNTQKRNTHTNIYIYNLRVKDYQKNGLTVTSLAFVNFPSFTGIISSNSTSRASERI